MRVMIADLPLGAGRGNGGWVYRDRVDARSAGETALAFYAARYRHTDAAGWRAAMDAGRVLRNGVPLSPDDRLARGDRLEWARPPWREPPSPLAFDVVHEDAHVLAAAKPSGLPVLPGGGFLESTLLHLVRGGRAERATWSPAHRLGRGTSGIVLFGKTRAASRALAEELRARRAVKLYLAIVSGVALPDRFVVRAPIGAIAHALLGAIHAATPCGKPAETRARVLARDGGGRALVLARPITGRPHQIRIHMAAAGAPLVGDPFFAAGGGPRAGGAIGALARGAGAPPGASRVARVGDCGYRLHAWRVRIRHPDGSGSFTIRAPIPSGFFEGTSFADRLRGGGPAAP